MIDRTDWKYRFSPMRIDEKYVKFIEDDAIRILEENNISSDVYVFPKFLSELDDDTFNQLCECFKRIVVSKDLFHIIVTLLRYPDKDNEPTGAFKVSERDKERKDKIIGIIKEKGFSMEPTEIREGLAEGVHVNQKTQNKYLNDYDPEFEYTDERKESISKFIELNCCCKKYKDCSENKKQGCKENLNKYPIIYTNTICYQICTFKRIES